ncbi:MAG: hypothetical protein IAG13_22280 [Deltaproteobacteria bacterium]|nr:hypothetical protein [Nannocystaceae bacterium]
MADPTETEPTVVPPVEPPPPTGLFGRVAARWKALRKRLSDLFAEYGSIAIVTYFAIFFATWIGITIAIRAGAEVEGAAGETGSIGAAYVATKLTQPLRILATLAVTPFAAMLWHRLRGKKPAVARPVDPDKPPAGPPA